MGYGYYNIPGCDFTGYNYSPYLGYNLNTYPQFSNYMDYMNTNLGSMQMYGNYMNPLLMFRMQNEMQTESLINNNSLKQLYANSEVQNAKITNNSLVSKIMITGDLNHDMKNLYAKIKEGDLKNVCVQFDNLLDKIYNNYRSELEAFGPDKNPRDTATYVIEELYEKIIKEEYGEDVNLRSDIKKYGENALKNGFNQGLRSGHSTYDVDETYNHCFGMGIDNKRAKNAANFGGKVLGRSVSAVEKGILGAGAGTAITATGLGLTSLGCKAIKGNGFNVFRGKGRLYSVAAFAGAVAGMLGDIIWKSTANA